AYTRKDMNLLYNRFTTMKGHNRIMVTTEKDAVRMAASPYFPPELRAHTFYVPVKVEFSTHGNTTFEEAIARYLRDFLK
ncbi:MAG: tetraacyldisaccharide 4'-kinase, partial [Muribaculaceae bacterium]|nr:tetraacyldisaccharide 4'-kinase [Muribaculaceae bacterium]